jgi:hypothetical protein
MVGLKVMSINIGLHIREKSPASKLESSHSSNVLLCCKPNLNLSNHTSKLNKILVPFTRN